MLTLPQNVATILHPPPFNVGNLPRWSAAVRAMRGGVRNARVNCVGDSVTAGAGSNGSGSSMTAARPLSYPAQMAALFRSTGINALASSINGGNNQTTSATYTAYNAEAVFAAGWATTGSTYGGNLIRGGTTDSRMGWTPAINGAAVPVDTFEILFTSAANGGTVAVYLNGSGTPLETFSITGAQALVKKTYTVPLGVNTIEVARTSAINFAYFSQMSAWNSTQPAILFANGGQPSDTAAQISDATTPISARPVQQALLPDLTLITTGLNDFVPNTSQASFEASLNALIDTAQVTGDAVLIFPNSRGSVNEPTFLGYFQNVATARNVPLLNNQLVLGTLAQATASGYMSNDGVHPNAAGYRVIASYIFDNITP